MSDHNHIEKDLLEKYRLNLKESIDYFSNKNKNEREKWVLREFLLNFDLKFQENEFKFVDDDPPDIIFRDFVLEIKEIVDSNRERHKEYKAEYEKALKACSIKELFTQFSPINITPEVVASIVETKLLSLNKKYPVDVRLNLDLLIYLNLNDTYLKFGQMPDNAIFNNFNWRSISVLLHKTNLILSATENAPDKIKQYVGSIKTRTS